LERSRGRRRCVKECATAVAQVTGALLNATRFSFQRLISCYTLQNHLLPGQQGIVLVARI